MKFFESVPCELCCSNIISGYVVKLKKEDPQDDDRFICSSCADEIENAQREYMDFSNG